MRTVTCPNGTTAVPEPYRDIGEEPFPVIEESIYPERGDYYCRCHLCHHKWFFVPKVPLTKSAEQIYAKMRKYDP